MQKIEHLFHDENGLATPRLDEDYAWVLEEDTKATIKWDGEPHCVIDGELYRHDPSVKDTWTLINPKRAQDKRAAGAWLRLAIELGCFAEGAPVAELFQTAACDSLADKVANGTYELVGPGIMSNHHLFEEPTLIVHGYGQVDVSLKGNTALEAFLACHKALLAVYCEGIVFLNDAGDMVQVTRKDFGILWPDPSMVEALEAQAKAAAEHAAKSQRRNGLRLLGPTGRPL